MVSRLVADVVVAMGTHNIQVYSARIFCPVLIHKSKGLSTLLEDFAVYITGEGDNMVMAQQNARYLLSKYKKGFFAKSGLQNTSLDYFLNSEHGKI